MKPSLRLNLKSPSKCRVSITLHYIYILHALCIISYIVKKLNLYSVQNSIRFYVQVIQEYGYRHFLYATSVEIVHF